ncbi:hypothetical protein M8C21_018257, partial [Ambrosia artemisiifolia]
PLSLSQKNPTFYLSRSPHPVFFFFFFSSHSHILNKTMRKIIKKNIRLKPSKQSQTLETPSPTPSLSPNFMIINKGLRHSNTRSASLIHGLLQFTSSS